MVHFYYFRLIEPGLICKSRKFEYGTTILNVNLIIFYVIYFMLLSCVVVLF